MKPIELILLAGLVWVAQGRAVATAERTETARQPAPRVYLAQSGDCLPVVARRFGVTPSEISSPDPLPAAGLLAPGQRLLLPARLSSLPAGRKLLPDSEVVYSPSTAGFHVSVFLDKAGGYLSSYREYLRSAGWASAAEIIQRVALENSIHPRLLLALLEYQCGCVYGPLAQGVNPDYLLGKVEFRQRGLYRQLSWAASQLSAGYYGWRSGRQLDFTAADGKRVHPAPDLNAGSVAVQYFFARLYGGQELERALAARAGLPGLHARLFGEAWERAKMVEPLFPAGLGQPELILPFERERWWSLTSGPHSAWEKEGAQAALDFAPATYDSGCQPTNARAVAVAGGLVVRSEFAEVVLDLDGDGLEATGWAILYMHIGSQGRVPAGTRLRLGDPIGYPSCEGGPTTGTHLHIARKYNGEWVEADSPLPFVLDGWRAHAGSLAFQGSLTRGEQTVIAHPYGSYETKIKRP